jgi:hypothetical protein
MAPLLRLPPVLKPYSCFEMSWSQLCVALRILKVGDIVKLRSSTSTGDIQDVAGMKQLNPIHG